MELIFFGGHSGNSSGEQGQSLSMERRVAAPSAICASALIECELEQGGTKQHDIDKHRTAKPHCLSETDWGARGNIYQTNSKLTKHNGFN